MRLTRRAARSGSEVGEPWDSAPRRCSRPLPALIRLRVLPPYITLVRQALFDHFGTTLGYSNDKFRLRPNLFAHVRHFSCATRDSLLTLSPLAEGKPKWRHSSRASFP